MYERKGGNIEIIAGRRITGVLILFKGYNDEMAGGFDQNIIFRVQEANDIVDVISEHVSLTKKGKEMVGLCPFHQDNRPSMNVSVVKQIFKCFACGAGGDVFKFVQMRENLSFPQAVERLADRAGIKVEAVKRRSRPENKPAIDPNRLGRVNAWAGKYFQETLADKKKGKDARAYLADRGISDESIKKWQLGLGGGGEELLERARSRNGSVELLAKAGFIVGQNHGRFDNRLMFTITDVTGRVIGFGGRTLDGDSAKYINSPATALFDKSNSLYGLEQSRHEIVKSGVAIVVEGYTDVIMAHQFGCCNVVATLGTSFTEGHGRMLRRYAGKVVLLFDNDVAGIAAANRALDVCLSQRIDIRLASIPEGKDPCEYLLSAGKKGFEKLIEQSVDVFQFKWDRLKSSFASDESFAGRKAATEEFLETVAVSLRSGNLSAIDKGLIVNRLAKVVGMEAAEINAELSKRVRRGARAASYHVENQKAGRINFGDGLLANAQREILEVLLNEPALFENVKGKVTVESFDVPILNQIACRLFEMLNDGGQVSISGVLGGIESVEVGNAVMELGDAGEEKGNFESRLCDALEIIARYRCRLTAGEIKSVEDQKRFLRRAHENASKGNPYNPGMI